LRSKLKSPYGEYLNQKTFPFSMLSAYLVAQGFALMAAGWDGMKLIWRN
jgi:hypothetical protein